MKLLGLEVVVAQDSDAAWTDVPPGTVLADDDAGTMMVRQTEFLGLVDKVERSIAAGLQPDVARMPRKAPFDPPAVPAHRDPLES